MAILRTHGFVQLRRGLMEHIFEGQMSPTQVTLYVAILINADPSSGIWCGSAGLLAALCHMPKRTCRDGIERLEKAGYLKRFAEVGKNTSYPILVHRFECSVGAATGKRLNAYGTSDYLNPTYESCQPSGELSVQPGVQLSVQPSAAKYLDNREQIKEPSPNPPFALSPPSGGNGHAKVARFSPSEIESIYQHYPRKVGKEDGLKAIKKALNNLDDPNPVNALRARVMMFAASPAGKKGEYVPYPASWFNKKHYLDDPEEWER